MLEQAIQKLTAEIQKLRETIERQNPLLGGRSQVPTSVVPSTPPNTTLVDAYLNDRATADLIGVSVATLRRWRLIRSGPPFRKIGRLVRYSRVEVLAWVDAQRPTSAGSRHMLKCRDV